jgi:hypothetical protein
MVKPMPTINTSRAFISSLENFALGTATTALSVGGCYVACEGFVFGAFTLHSLAVGATTQGEATQKAQAD